MKELAIMGILIDKREKSAPKVQDVLTKYGDSILSRFGLHDPGEEQHGLITLNVRDSSPTIDSLSKELAELDGVEVKRITMK